MFTSDPEGLFNLLGGSEQSGTLTLQPDTHATWKVRFTLVRGQPTACEMISQTASPIKVEPARAIEELSKQRRALQWALEPSELEPGPGVGESVQASDSALEWRPWDRPCRGKREPLPASWERLQRSIFLLIDNHRTIKDIALLLNKRVEDIQHPLQALYRDGWIGKTT